MKKLDKNTPVPLYFQLKGILLDAIKDGKYEVDDNIPTEKEISEMYDISRTTVRQAIAELVQEGWLYREKSKGTFVQMPKINQSFMKSIGSFNEQMEEIGLTPSTELLNYKVVKANESVVENLKCNESEDVIYIHRKRLADNEPVVTVETYLPYERCSFVEEYNLQEQALYPILALKKETKIYKVHRYIQAVEATELDAQYLNIEIGKAIQKVISIGYNIFDEPIEFSIARYRGDKNTFEIIISG